MTIDLNELERLAREATPGPWRVGTFGCVYGAGVSGLPVPIPADDGDDAYIAAASPDVMLALIQRVRVAETERDAYLGNLTEEAREQAFPEFYG